jgi:hypothetical protein
VKAPEGGDEMTERETSGEELIDDEGRNQTQQEIDGDEPGPANQGEGWEETNDEPAQGEGGQEIV